jgi:alkylation response protein AidB-like acyl-CoA dehydrogenase
VLQPLNRVGDEHGCTATRTARHDAPGFKEAWDQFVAGGWTTLSAPEEYGGQGLPHVVSTAMAEYLCAANHSFEMYNGLTRARSRHPGQGLGRAEGDLSARTWSAGAGPAP